jgi:hypothetical protein
MTGATEVFDEDTNSLEIETLRKAQKFLLVALAGAVLFLPLSLTAKAMTVGIVCLAITLIAGVAGIKGVREVQGSSGALELLAMLSLFVPGFNLAVLGLFLHTANKGIRDKEGAARLASARNRLKQRPAGESKAPPKPNGQMADRISKAMPLVKLADLPNLPECTPLEAKVTSPAVADPSGDSNPVVRAVKGVFGVMYAIDEGNSLAFVNMGDVRAAGITLDQLHEISLRNLAAKVNDKTAGLKLKRLENSFGLVLGGYYEASLVLLDNLWEGPLKAYIPNAPLVTIAARDICAFCDKASAAGKAELKGICDRVSQRGDHLISREMFTRNADGRWLKYEG